MKTRQRISTCLWFDDRAEEAARFYTSVFEDSTLGDISRYDAASAEVSGRPEGSVLTVDFTLDGYAFVGLNGGPLFEPNPSISFFVSHRTAGEVDALWDALFDGGEALMPLDEYPFSERYGWVRDRFGITWQVILAPEGSERGVMPSLLFVGDNCGRAEEAIGFYTSVFEGSKPGQVFRYGAGQEPDTEGTVAFADFELEGQPFAAMDSARDHTFTFNEAISLVVDCETQEDVDRYWEALSAVPEAEQCGWLRDRYGVSWQIVPSRLYELLGDPDPERSGRAMEAMLKMKRLDIAALEEAHAGRHA